MAIFWDLDEVKLFIRSSETDAYRFQKVQIASSVAQVQKTLRYPLQQSHIEAQRNTYSALSVLRSRA